MKGERCNQTRPWDNNGIVKVEQFSMLVSKWAESFFLCFVSVFPQFAETFGTACETLPTFYTLDFESVFVDLNNFWRKQKNKKYQLCASAPPGPLKFEMKWKQIDFWGRRNAEAWPKFLSFDVAQSQLIFNLNFVIENSQYFCEQLCTNGSYDTVFFQQTFLGNANRNFVALSWSIFVITSDADS